MPEMEIGVPTGIGTNAFLAKVLGGLVGDSYKKVIDILRESTSTQQKNWAETTSPMEQRFIAQLNAPLDQLWPRVYQNCVTSFAHRTGLPIK